ncbi:MAG TPA: cyanophycinase [Terriglobales bacterium]|jgi:cyanophycinase
MRTWLLTLSLALGAVVAAQTPTPAYTYQRSGPAQDRAGAPRAGFLLMGGGTDVDEGFQWMCRRAGGGDFLVLRASGTDAYDPYIVKLCPGMNSVATLIIPSRQAAEDGFVARRIAEASAIFISGGDQSNYVNFWTGTPVQRALDAAIRRGVPIGGTSAGLAVLGEFVYSAQNDHPKDPNLTSAAALANPFHPQVVVARHFLAIPQLRGLITDSHFHNRDRLGRLLVFLARILQSGDATTIHGVGVDQHTALEVDGEGEARAVGTGHVYLIAAAGKPEVCQSGQPLTFGPIAARRLDPGQSFSLRSWSGAGESYTLRVRGGTVASDQPGGSIY